jgi:sigma-E factor negative regulatory protein RseC
MISEQGIIEEVSARKAIVRVRKSSACKHCSSKDSCSISDRDMLVEVDNDLQAKVGDHVEISVPEGTLLKISALVYLFPIIALIIGAFLGDFLAKHLLQTNSSWIAIIVGFIFLGIVFFGLKIFERTKRSGDSYYPRMTRILTNVASPQPCDNR